MKFTPPPGRRGFNLATGEEGQSTRSMPSVSPSLGQLEEDTGSTREMKNLAEAGIRKADSGPALLVRK